MIKLSKYKIVRQFKDKPSKVILENMSSEEVTKYYRDHITADKGWFDRHEKMHK